MSEAPTILLPFAKQFLASQNTVKVWEKSRRIGASWSCASMAALRAAAQRTAKIRGMNVWYIGYNKDMALEFVNDCGFWSREYQLAAEAVEQEVFKDEDKDILSYVIRYSSGNRITALSSRPTNLRGKQGLVIIDEAAFHDQLGELMKAALALLMWGGEVWVISTHNGIECEFYQLCDDIKAGRRPYYLQKTTLDDALVDGLYQRICLKLGKSWSCEAEARWRQELIDQYGENSAEELFCIPKNGGGRYFPGVLLDRCFSAEVPIVRLALGDEFKLRPEEERVREVNAWLLEVINPLLENLDPNLRSFMGQDFGRSGDLSCILPLQELPNLTLVAPFAIEERNVPFEQQRQVLFHLCDRLPRFCGGALDANGNGAYLAEVAQQRYGASLIHEIKASDQFYAENYPRYKARMEDDRLIMPADSDWKDDHRQVVVVSGTPRVPKQVRSKGADGKPRHGDAAIAGLMAEYAARNAGSPIEYKSSGKPQVHRELTAFMGNRRHSRGLEGWM